MGKHLSPSFSSVQSLWSNFAEFSYKHGQRLEVRSHLRNYMKKLFKHEFEHNIAVLSPVLQSVVAVRVTSVCVFKASF